MNAGLSAPKSVGLKGILQTMSSALLILKYISSHEISIFKLIRIVFGSIPPETMLDIVISNISSDFLSSFTEAIKWGCQCHYSNNELRAPTLQSQEKKKNLHFITSTWSTKSVCSANHKFLIYGTKIIISIPWCTYVSTLSTIRYITFFQSMLIRVLWPSFSVSITEVKIVAVAAPKL